MLRIDIFPTHEYEEFKLRRGKPLPFGATIVPEGINFSSHDMRFSTEAI